MKQLLLMGTVGVLMATMPLTVRAEEDASEPQTPYAQAYDLCAEMADDQEASNDGNGESHWNESLENCMADKGFDPNNESSSSDYDAEISDEPYSDSDYTPDP